MTAGPTIEGAEPNVGEEPREIEVKLGVERQATIRRLLMEPDLARLAGFGAAGDVHIVRQTDRYLDTSPWQGRLSQLGVRARLRREGATVTLTVKRSGVEIRGVSTRVEMHGGATRSLDPQRWPDSRARALLLKAAAGEPLEVIAQLRQRRLTRRLVRDGTFVELSLDAMQAMADGRVTARRFELEAELVGGDEVALAELGEALQKLDGIGPPEGSKLQFALAGALV